MSFLGLVVRNLRVRKVRSVLTALAVAVGVLAVVTLSLINDSVRSSALALLQTGRADFTVAQSGVSDVLNSNIQQVDVAKVGAVPGVSTAIGALVATVRLNSTYPLFLEIGVDAKDLHPFGIRILQGRAYSPDSTDEVLLGYQAADNLHKAVGDEITVDGNRFTIVGIYSVGQALGDSATRSASAWLVSRPSACSWARILRSIRSSVGPAVMPPFNRRICGIGQDLRCHLRRRLRYNLLNPDDREDV